MRKPDTSITRAVISVFKEHMWRYRGTTLVLFVSVVAFHSLEVIRPLFYKQFFDTLAAANGVPAEHVAKKLTAILLIVIGTYLAAWVIRQIWGFSTTRYQSRIIADLEQSAFRYLIRHSHRFFINNFAGSLVRRVNRFARAFEELTDQLQFNVIPLIVTTIGILFVLFRRHTLLGIGLTVWVALFIAVNFFLARWKQQYDLKKSEADSLATGALADAIGNHATIRFFSGFSHEESLYKTATEKLRKIRTFAWNVNQALDGAQTLLMVAIEFVIMFFAIILWQRGALSIGDFALIQAYLVALFEKLWSFGRIMRRTYEGFADAAEMVEILRTPHEVQDIKNAKSLMVTRGEIAFEETSFSFQKTRKVLDRFTVTVRSGEKVALVGPSGAGKTTVTALLLRLYDLDHGRILIDGQNIALITQESLRNQIALVPQEPILFHRTLKENIWYGKRSATQREVEEAGALAHCGEFIAALPQGLETYVGERGVKLSGGERQRIAIARAILKNAPILVLDEATSSLDSHSESLIQDALRKLMEKKTAIVIAHRLSTIMQMDRIVVLDKGHIVREGTHEALLKEEGIYKRLWEIQAGGFIP